MPPFTYAVHAHELEAITSTVGTLMHREVLEMDTSRLHGRKPRLLYAVTEPPPGRLYWDNIAERIAGVPAHDAR